MTPEQARDYVIKMRVSATLFVSKLRFKSILFGYVLHILTKFSHIIATFIEESYQFPICC